MNRVKLSKEEIRRIFEVAQSTIATDTSRPFLQYAQVSVDGNRLVAVSLNGCKLSRLTMAIAEPVSEEFKFSIKPFALPKTLQSVEIVLDPSGDLNVALDCLDGLQYRNIQQPEEYSVNVDRLIPETDDDFTISLNAKLLTDILRPYTKGKNLNYPVQLKFAKRGRGISPNNPILLSSTSPAGERLESILLPLKL